MKGADSLLGETRTGPLARQLRTYVLELLGGAAVVLSCGGAKAPAHAPTAAPPVADASAAGPASAREPGNGAAAERPPRSVHATPSDKRVVLHYEVGGRHYDHPLVHATVAGTPAMMLVDTGAASHVLAGWLARKAGLSLKKRGDLGADHAGRTIAELRVDHPQLAIDGWGEVPDEPTLATEVPAFFEELGIGGFLSPQHLVEGDDGAVVLDFAAGEMRAAQYEQAVFKLGRRGHSLTPNGVYVCDDDSTAIHGLAFVLPGSVEGNTAGLLVDTGAEHSDLLASSTAGKALSSRSVPSTEQLYAAGGRLSARTVKGARLDVGDFAVHADVVLIPGESDPYCPRDGVVSMDVLRACVLVLGKAGMTGRCTAR